MPRILTVDDSATIRTIITKNLQELGYEVEHAEDGAQALAKLDAGLAVDLILLDVTMPVMDGPAMLDRLRAGGNPTPVIMLTSESKRSIIAGAMKLGIADYILKPFKPDELRAKVQKALDVPAPAAVAPVSVAAAPPKHAFVDVLVVDDMDNVHKKLRSLLPEPLSMTGCVSAREALAHCQERTYRVILIDLVIPDVNSVALMSQLRVLQPNAVMIGLALRSATTTTDEIKAQGFQDVLQKPFDPGALDDWRAKYFDVKDLVSVDDNVMSCAELSGKPERLDGYYTRLRGLCRESLEKLASACYEDAIVDLTRVPVHNERLPRLVMDMDAEAKKLGIALRIVGKPDVKKTLAALVETASVPFFASVGDAKAA